LSVVPDESGQKCVSFIKLKAQNSDIERGVPPCAVPTNRWNFSLTWSLR